MVPAPITMHLACAQSLTSSAHELKYERSAHLVDILSKDEDIRRLRFDIHILEDDSDEVRELLQQEEDRSDAFERLVSENLARAEGAEAQLRENEADLRGREQELLTLGAEKNALLCSTEDATAALTEKLALTRELSVLKPELDHLKAQAASTEALTAEKLALQRQLSDIKCEVENAKRETKRALAKRRNTGVEIAQEEQVDDLRRQLTKEKRARQRAEEAANVTQSDVHVDEVHKELVREKRARQRVEEKLEEAQNQAPQVEDVRKDLLREKKARQKLQDALDNLHAELESSRKAAAKSAAGAAEVDDGQADELRQEVAKEKKERVRAEKTAQKAAAEFESQRAVLDDKLNQFRNKLRTTKEKLKETEIELAQQIASAVSAPAVKKTATKAPTTTAAPKNAKKRNAAQIDADATNLGTPGDGPTAKRGRKAGAGMGDKSTFSITPFLNRTAGAAVESGDDASDKEQASPAVRKTKKEPLAAQPLSKGNVPPKKAAVPRKPKQLPALEIVAEEEAEDVHSLGQENARAAPAAVKGAATMKVKTKVVDGPDDDSAAAKKGGEGKRKIRKSIHEFANFNLQEPATVVGKKKKRKLGGLGKTLFDEEEEAHAAPAAAKSGFGGPSRAVFGAKGFGVLGGGKKLGLGGGLLGGSSRVGSTMMAAGDGSGFMFSPLKRARKNLDDTLRG
ncbi:hypothetical protein LTR08_005797 [Meristemomyces frigidus]|nr:hypothetical protein LTR08_005797 [Meristemomyces frigidus]